jgi:type III secretory pathway component EscS
MVILLVTGIVQTIAEPTREIMNYTFRIKMIMLAIVLAITVAYRWQAKKDANYWSGERQTLARSLAAFSLVLWLGIVAAGRLVAYVGGIEA